MERPEKPLAQEKVTISFHTDAATEIQVAHGWYESQREGLGLDFVLSVEACLASIERDPGMHPFVYKNVRRALLKRFPYGIFYVEHKQRILVLAVFHAKRHPQIWKNRE